ncbi:MAG: rRNA maturation RNase YbeY [Eubacteriales bacterium]|nr:rRNA maturation RNase YbeY [Eubacteriales bacterium]MDD4389927.1 rRNA maturation RNase YbeY [Eubacteriales bacterium]
MGIIYDETQIDQDLINHFQRAALCCLNEEQIPGDDVEISLTFVTLDEIKEINCEYRGKDIATDVLSFPQYEREDLDKIVDDKGSVILLGDVVICPQKAQEQATEFSHSKERELTYLFVHSIFHLLGYDHMQDDQKSVMRQKEEKVMALLGLEREAQI